ncbi:type II toxin-antitoxin system VapC family toxin [Pedobacter kyonggii]|uniref:Type II toxin-antitoxin system VapC family toxin n=1 Tax=Pedobacter kyonggii TaxID=1926871 RepID=A0A4Q9H6V2_9SPHI|nr:type II toxin-antitoxin system VapC family toxin [Pedobacter kyonggii]TBO38863.1 type II toxin-antitoxin system VapC family toxin [Pedobacter kyonggii]
MAKEKIICDTDVSIDYFDKNKSRNVSTITLLETDIGLDNVIISSITKMELLSGATNKLDLNIINKKLSRFSIVLINERINLTAINLMQNFKLSHGLPIPDSLIAATAIETELKLFTYNLKDFRFISDLTLYPVQ